MKESQTDWRCFRSFPNYSCSRITWVIYLQFLESEGYYLTKNWFVSAYLGYLHQQTKPEFSWQNQRTNCVMTNFCLDFCIRLKFQNCQISSALDLLMRPAGIVCQWTQTPVSGFIVRRFKVLKSMSFIWQREKFAQSRQYNTSSWVYPIDFDGRRNVEFVAQNHCGP